MSKKLFIHSTQAGVGQLWQWAWDMARGVKGRVGMMCLIGILRVAASLGFVWVSKVLIDAATCQTTPMSSIWWLSALLALCMVLELALSQWRTYLTLLTRQRMVNSLRHRIYSHLLNSDIYSDNRHSGDTLNRITIDVGKVVGAVVSTLPDIIVMIVQLIAAFWLLCVMNPMLALCALIITPICIIASKAYMMKMRRINAEIRQGESLIHTNIQEGLQHRVVVQTLECAPEITSRFERLQQSLFGNTVVSARVSAFSRSTVRTGFIAGYLVAFIWSVFGLHSGAITYGIMVAFLQLVGRIQGPISSLSGTVPTLVETATAIDRLMEIYPTTPTTQTAPTAPTAPTTPTRLADPIGISLEKVTFAYPGTDTPVFTDFCYDFAPGSKTVIMGETGVGKSTLTKLILALLSPQSGTIEAYNATGVVPVSAATRILMTYVPQGNSLLHGTIRDNLRLGDPNATEEQMRQALSIAVANFVYDLPLGLDTPCGELGSGLSEGQCQRIAIARALLRQCPVLILDEFNSSLDQDTAETLLRRLLEARPQSTIILISHRPEVAASCDTLLQL